MEEAWEYPAIKDIGDVTMAAPLPPDMETKAEKLSRRLSSLSAGGMGFILGTAFGVAFSSLIVSAVSTLSLFMAVAAIIGLYWYLAKGKDKKKKDETIKPYKKNEKK